MRLVVHAPYRQFQPRLARAASLLSPSQLEQYHCDGFTRDFKLELSSEDLERGRRGLLELMESNPGVPPELLVNSHIEDDTGSIRGSSIFLDLASKTQIVEVASQLLGSENVILWACQVCH